jgi:hypothetical protein
MNVRASRLPGWLLPTGLVVMVVVLVAIAMTRGPTSFDPDSPEGAVQEYLQAINEQRWEDAVGVIHPEWLGSCDAGDIAGFAPSDFTADLGNDGGSVFGGGRFIEETFTAPAAGEEPQLPTNPDESVEVTITRDQGGGLGGGWSEYVRFELLDEDGFWWIINDPWPYFVWNCREF